MVATATSRDNDAPASASGDVVGRDIHVDFIPMDVDEALLVSGRVEMPLFIVTALYCLTDGKAEVAFCAGSHLAGR